jgi:hypothetical protein
MEPPRRTNNNNHQGDNVRGVIIIVSTMFSLGSDLLPNVICWVLLCVMYEIGQRVGQPSSVEFS